MTSSSVTWSLLPPCIDRMVTMNIACRFIHKRGGQRGTETGRQRGREAERQRGREAGSRTHTHTHTQDTHKTHTRHTHTHKTHTGIQTYLVNIGGNGNNGDDENANASKEKVAPEQKDKVRRLSNRLWSSWVPHCFCRPHTACSTHLYRRACALYNSGASTSGAPSLLLSPCPASMVYEPRAMSLPLLPANKGKGEAGGFVLKC